MQKTIEIHLPHYEIPQLSLRYRPLSSLPLQKVRIKKDELNLMPKYLKFLTRPQLARLLPACCRNVGTYSSGWMGVNLFLG